LRIGNKHKNNKEIMKV